MKKTTEDEKVKNLHDGEAVGKIKEIAGNAKICMFSTNLMELPINTRPMSPAEIDDEGNLWFFSDQLSDKNKEISDNANVQLTFSSVSNNEYLCIFGNAEIVTDTNKFKDFWTPIVKIWFEKGVEDPNLSLIKVIPKQSYYWDTQHNKMVAMLKMLVSVASGKKMDDSVEGKLNV